MKLYRIYFRNGTWFDVFARFMDTIDGYIWLWEMRRHDAVAIVPDGDVLMVAVKDSVDQQFVVPDHTHCLTITGGTGETIEPIDFDQPCWPDSTAKPS